jgi:hypothetical protein
MVKEGWNMCHGGDLVLKGRTPGDKEEGRLPLKRTVCHKMRQREGKTHHRNRSPILSHRESSKTWTYILSCLIFIQSCSMNSFALIQLSVFQQLTSKTKKI